TVCDLVRCFRVQPSDPHIVLLSLIARENDHLLRLADLPSEQALDERTTKGAVPPVTSPRFPSSIGAAVGCRIGAQVAAPVGPTGPHQSRCRPEAIRSQAAVVTNARIRLDGCVGVESGVEGL